MENQTEPQTEGVSLETISGLSRERLEELSPRLEAILADFAHLEADESPDLEPLPVFVVPDDGGDRRE
jgi:hypothetical protein